MFDPDVPTIQVNGRTLTNKESWTLRQGLILLRGQTKIAEEDGISGDIFQTIKTSLETLLPLWDRSY